MYDNVNGNIKADKTDIIKKIVLFIYYYEIKKIYILII